MPESADVILQGEFVSLLDAPVVRREQHLRQHHGHGQCYVLCQGKGTEQQEWQHLSNVLWRLLVQQQLFVIQRTIKGQVLGDSNIVEHILYETFGSWVK